MEKEMHEDIEVLKQMTKENQEDIKEMRKDIEILKQKTEQNTKDIKEMRKDIEILKQKTEQNTKDIKELRKMTEQNTKDIKEMREDIKSIQRTLAIIEDAVLNKIPALFDGYTMHQEKQEHLEKRVDKLEDVYQMLSLRLIAVEDNSNSKKVKLSS